MKNKKQTESSQSYATFLILISGVLWGSIGVFVTMLSRLGISSQDIVLLRLLSSVAVIAVVIVLTQGTIAFRLTLPKLFLTACLGIVSQGLYNLFYSRSILTLGIAVSSVLLYTAPIFTAVMSFIFFKEGFSKGKCISLCLNFIGATLAATNGSFDFKILSIMGIIYGLLAGFCYSTCAIFGRFIGDEINPLVISFYSFLFGLLSIIPTSNPSSLIELLDFKVILIGLFFGIITNVIPYFTYYSGLRKINQISKVPVIASIEMVCASVFGIFIYGEPIGLVSLIGIVFVLISIALINSRFGSTTKNRKNE